MGNSARIVLISHDEIEFMDMVPPVVAAVAAAAVWLRRQ